MMTDSRKARVEAMLLIINVVGIVFQHHRAAGQEVAEQKCIKHCGFRVVKCAIECVENGGYNSYSCVVQCGHSNIPCLASCIRLPPPPPPPLLFQSL